MKKQAGFATIYIVLGAIMLAMAGGFYLYYKDSQATIAQLTGDLAAAVIQVAEDKLIIEQNEEDAALNKIINATLNSELASSRVNVEDLRGVLKKKNKITGKTRDLGKLAIHRPKTMAKIFTKGTNNAMRCIELASGAEHTADELAAERRSQINGLCTALANPSYLPN